MSCAGCDDPPEGAVCRTPEGTQTPVEVHVTVAGDRRRFAEACEELGVRSLEIVNFSRDFSRRTWDRMTLSVCPDAESAWEEAQRVVAGLASGGLDVVRAKLEAAPWHPAGYDPAPEQYWESHLKLGESRSAERDTIQKLSWLGMSLGMHFSSSTKHAASAARSAPILATIRQHGVCREEHEYSVGLTRRTLRLSRIEVLRTTTELCLYDSCEEHDAQWMRAAS